MKFQVLYADPPWAYRNKHSGKRFNGTAHNSYNTIDEKEMAKWRVEQLAADDSLLFLWATFPKLPEALFLMQAWGFTFVTCPFVWNKTYRSGTPFCGVGFWTRNGAEIVMMGRKGKGVPRQSKGVYQVVTAPALRPHSRKPIEIRNQIERLVGTDISRIELFARKHEPEEDQPHLNGWEATGIEYDGRTIEEAITHYVRL